MRMLFLPALVCLVLLLGQVVGAEERSESHSRTVRFSEEGVDPSQTIITRDDQIVFFLNDSHDSLLTLQVNFAKKAFHCATPEMKLDTTGALKSVQPFPPKEFAAVCFHEPGVYPFKVFGLKGKPQGLAGSIEVQ